MYMYTYIYKEIKCHCFLNLHAELFFLENFEEMAHFNNYNLFSSVLFLLKSAVLLMLYNFCIFCLKNSILWYDIKLMTTIDKKTVMLYVANLAGNMYSLQNTVSLKFETLCDKNNENRYIIFKITL